MMDRNVAGIPSDLPIVERDVVRLVVRDDANRMLLFHTRELSAPELGTWWELPGGGFDPGESYVDAAVRELREETGITRSPTRTVGHRRGRYQHPATHSTALLRASGRAQLAALDADTPLRIRSDAPGAATEPDRRRPIGRSRARSGAHR
jgi:8-oxo-dGTP pyrophosphatase MutT (NUDIX family)